MEKDKNQMLDEVNVSDVGESNDKDTWSVKMNKAEKFELKEFLSQNDIKATEFIRKAFQLYKVDEIVQGDNVLSPELKEVAVIAERLQGIFVNANERVNTRIKQVFLEAEETSKVKDKYIDSLEEKLENTQTELENSKTRNAELDVEKNAALSRIADLCETTDKALAEAESMRGTNDTLMDTIKGLQADREQNKVLKAELAGIEEKHAKAIDAITHQYETEKKEKENALSNLSNAEKDHTAALKDKDRDHDIEIVTLKKDFARELDQAQKDNKRDMDTLIKDQEREMKALREGLETEYAKEINKLKHELTEASSDKKEAVLDVQTEHLKEVTRLQQEIQRLQQEVLKLQYPSTKN